MIPRLAIILTAATTLTACGSPATAPLTLTASNRSIIGDAAVLGPTGFPDPAPWFVTSADVLYFNQLGFTGDSHALWTPEAGNNQSYIDGLAQVENAVREAWDNGQFSADNPLWLFGYSQSATILSQAQYDFASPDFTDNGPIPTDALHFVFVGDPASTHGGFTNAVDPFWMQIFGYNDMVGIETPDDLYPTDVFTIPGDGWADTNGSPFGVLNLQHLMYLGVTPEEVQQAIDAGPTYDDGLTNYYTIDLDWAQQWDALMSSLMAELHQAPISAVGTDWFDSLFDWTW
ncbi:PE-PPE domain-containing protein [Mycobacterium sp. CSUR Q5927]|nr:PE-PPE domain-containing protein [Mycobacterium sp. CSUR Q5927]